MGLRIPWIILDSGPLRVFLLPGQRRYKKREGRLSNQSAEAWEPEAWEPACLTPHSFP